MTELTNLLVRDELFLLFVTLAFGLALGRLSVRGVRLGLAGVLFFGLALSAIFKPEVGTLRLAPQLKEFGLVLFVYCVGLTSGPGFFTAFKDRGVRLNVTVGIALLAGALLTLLGGRLLGLDRGVIAGIFCGALTNTPALGAATERLANTALELRPVIGYSVTYPFGVLGALACFRVFVILFKRELEQERQQAQEAQGAIGNVNVRVTSPDIAEHSIGELRIRDAMGVWISRLSRAGQLSVPTKYSVLKLGDVMTLVGEREELLSATQRLGEPVAEHLEEDRTQVDMRRVLVSRGEHVGRSLEELDLSRRFNAQVTRLRRADVDFVPSPAMRLELGDRLRLVAPKNRLPELSAFFGDSERELAHVDYVAMALGVSAGLVLARVPLPLLGTRLELGAAGGPLLMALLLGRLGRTGPLVWMMPYETNCTLRDLGLLLFLSGVGISAGSSLGTLWSAEGLIMLSLGAVVTLTATSIVLVLARVWAKTTVVPALGAASGMQTQPATLEAAYELSGESGQTYVSYALVYPISMIGKILLAQLLALLA